MTPKISLITAVTGAALVLAVPAAWGKGQPVDPVSTQPQVLTEFVMADDAFGRGVKSALALQSTAITSPDAVDRVKAAHLSQQSNPITSPDAVDRAAAAKQSEPGWLKALRIRGEGLDRQYGVGKFAPTSTSTGGQVFVDHRSEWLDPDSLPVAVLATTSESDIEWPQIGAGLGIGIVLAFGLVLALRHGRGRPLAHG